MTDGTPPSPMLVLMAGLPGAGKTTLATALGHTTGWFVLHKDELKDWFLLQGLKDGEASWQAYEESFKHIYNKLVGQQKSIILDTSAQYPFVVERSIKLARSANARLKVVLCQASDEVRFLRLGGRPARTSPLDLHAPPLPVNLPDEHQRFKHLPAHTLLLNTESSLEVCLATVQQYLHAVEY